jgi:hypothetical protein
MSLREAAGRVAKRIETKATKQSQYFGIASSGTLRGALLATTW